MKTNTSKKILEYIQTKKQATPKELAEHLGISPQALYRQLKKLQQQNNIRKIGISPKVFYKLAENQTITKDISLDDESIRFLDNYFYWITPLGQTKEGAEGFIWWIHKSVWLDLFWLWADFCVGYYCQYELK